MLNKHWNKASEAAPAAASPPPSEPSSITKPKAKQKSKAKVKAPQDATYEVGHCKPPKHSQFKQGQSGNLKGRPKRPKPLEDTLAAELVKIVTVSMEGVPMKMSQAEVMMKAAMRLAMNGNLQAIRLIMAGWGMLPPEAAEHASVSQADLELLQEIIAGQLAASGGDPTQDT